MADQRLLSIHHLRRSADFQRVYQREVFVTDEVLVLRGCKNGLPYSRLGLSVSGKVGGAVVRNRWKRLMREAFRLHREQFPTGIDFVLHPRRGAEADFEAISRSLPRLACRVAKRLKRSSG